MNKVLEQGLVGAYQLVRNTNAFIWPWIAIIVAVVVSQLGYWPDPLFGKALTVLLTSVLLVGFVGFVIGLFKAK